MRLKDFKKMVAQYPDKKYPGYDIQFLVQKVEDVPDVVYIGVEFVRINVFHDTKVVELEFKGIEE